jgi:hypothetical protein
MVDGGLPRRGLAVRSAGHESRAGGVTGRHSDFSAESRRHAERWSRTPCQRSLLRRECILRGRSVLIADRVLVKGLAGASGPRALLKAQTYELLATAPPNWPTTLMLSPLRDNAIAPCSSPAKCEASDLACRSLKALIAASGRIFFAFVRENTTTKN